MFLKKVWQEYKRKPFRYIFDVVIFLSAIATITGLFLLIPQAQLINEQLKEINSQPLIKINFNLATSTIMFGPTVSEPIDIILTTKNEGNKVASYWRGSIVFCKHIKVISSENWFKEKDVENQYIVESNKVIPPTFPDKLKFYSYSLDNFGSFKIILPNINNSKLERPIPIGQVTISGDYNHPLSYLVSLTHPSGFIYENLLQADGRMDKDFLSKVKGCFDIINQTKDQAVLTNH